MGTSRLVIHAVVAITGALAFARGTHLSGGKHSILAQQLQGLTLSLSCGIPRQYTTSFGSPALGHHSPGCKHKGGTSSHLVPWHPHPLALGYIPSVSTQKGWKSLFKTHFFPGLLTPAPIFEALLQSLLWLFCSRCCNSHQEEENPATTKGRDLLSPEGHTWYNNASQMCTEVLSNCYGNHFTCAGFFKAKV